MPTNWWVLIKIGVFLGIGLMFAVVVVKIAQWLLGQAEFPNL